MGSIHYHEPAQRYYIALYWPDGLGKKKTWKIWRRNGEPMFDKRDAVKLLSIIQGEIEVGTFRLKAYLPDSPLSLKEYSEVWLRASSACANTQRFYRAQIKKAVSYFGEEFDIRHFTLSKLEIFYNGLDMSIKGKYNVLSTLRTMLRYAVRDEALHKMPAFPELPIGLPEDIEYLEYEDQMRVVGAIPERHRLPFLFGMCFGLRIGEITALHKSSVSREELVIQHAHSNGVLQGTKTKKRDKLPMTSGAWSLIEAAAPLSPFSEFVFTKDGIKPYKYQYLWQTWRDACKQVGIEIKLYNGIRHSLASQMLNKNYPLDLVQSMLRHSTSEMTRRYAKRSQKTLRDALESYGQVVEMPKRKMEGE